MDQGPHPSELRPFNPSPVPWERPHFSQLCRYLVLAQEHHYSQVPAKYLPVLHPQPDSSSPLHPSPSVSLFLIRLPPTPLLFVHQSRSTATTPTTSTPPRILESQIESSRQRILPSSSTSPQTYCIDLATAAILPTSAGLVHDHLDPNAPHSPSQSSRHTLNPTGARASESKELDDFNHRSVKSVSNRPIADQCCPPSPSLCQPRFLRPTVALPGFSHSSSTKLSVQQPLRDRPTLTMPGAAVDTAPSVTGPAAASTNTAPGGKISHAPERKYKCQYCSRAFSRSEHRSRHERSRRCFHNAPVSGKTYQVCLELAFLSSRLLVFSFSILVLPRRLVTLMSHELRCQFLPRS